MKSLKNRRTKNNQSTISKAMGWSSYICLLSLPLLMVACGGSLGKIQTENVDAAITEAEKAIEHARFANAHTLAPETMRQAEDALAGARKAVEAKDGLEAMRLAYDAQTQARMAEQEAMYKSQEEGLNAIIKRKETAILELQSSLKTADAELEEVRTEMQRLELKRSQLQTEMEQKIRNLERDRQQALQDYRSARDEMEQLQARLDGTEAQYLKAQNEAEEYERQIYQLRREVALAQSMVEEAQKEASQARSRAKTQAQNYTKQIERLDQEDTLKRSKAQTEKMLAQKAQEARAYAQQRETWDDAKPSGVTSLTDRQIAQGKAVINDWEIAWASKDTNQHFNEYAQDATVKQIIIRSNAEKRTELNRTQMADALRKMIGEQWVKTDSRVETDGESVVGTYLFSRLSQRAGNGNQPPLYDVWSRQVWVKQVGNQWKISREIWRIYENVPKYATLFN